VTTARKNTLPRLPIAFRIVVVLAIGAGFAIRVSTKQWDPSVFLQFVFSVFGLAFTARGRADETAKPVDRTLQGLVALTVVIVCTVIVASSKLTVPTIAPMVISVIALAWAMLLRQFRTVFFVVPLVLLVPLAVWQVVAIREGGERNRFLHVAPEDLARVEMQSPDGSRRVVLDEAQRRSLASVLGRAVPHYPNHEGIRDAWHVRMTLRDGSSRELLIGHGSRSLSYAWIEFGAANDFAVGETLESIVARLAPDPARVACERMAREACSVAASCNPGGRVDLLVPDDHGGQGVISFFRREDECVDSYLRRRCDPGGFACAPGEAVHCVDLDAVRYGSAHAALVPLSCAAVFREAR
jgi:hypothetical protein